METFEALKRKIRVSKDLRSIVRTMKSLAAVGMRQAEAALQGLEQYRKTIDLGLALVIGDGPQPPLSTRTGTVGAIVFGSDQGLCGQFNERIATHAATTLKESLHPPEQAVLLAVGERTVGALEDTGLRVERALSTPGSAAGATPLVQEMLLHVDRWMSRGHFDQILLFYTKPLRGAALAPSAVRLVPVELPSSRVLPKREGPQTLGFYTMPRLDLLAALIREHIFATLYGALLGSMYSENLSRFATTSAAEKNIDEAFRNLRSRFHQQRQTAVTAELLDISSGVEAQR